MRPLRGEGRTPWAVPAYTAEGAYFHIRSAALLPGMPVELTGNGQINSTCPAAFGSVVGGWEHSGAVAHRRIAAFAEERCCRLKSEDALGEVPEEPGDAPAPSVARTESIPTKGVRNRVNVVNGYRAASGRRVCLLRQKSRVPVK